MKFRLNGRELALLRTSTGKTAFRLTSDHAEAGIEQPQRILDQEATTDEVEPNARGRFIGDKLLVDHAMRLAGESDAEAYDVYNLEDIQLGSEPSGRILQTSLSECAPGDHVLQGLQEHEGRLTFLTVEG